MASGKYKHGIDQLLHLCWLFKLKLAELETQIVSLEKDGGFDERVAAVSNESFLRRSKVDWMKIEKLLLDAISGNVPPK